MHIHFLMGMTAVIIAGHIARYNYHGDGVEGGVGNAGNGVGKAGAQMAHYHGSLAGKPGIAIGGGGRYLLMTNRDILELVASVQSIQQTDYGMSAKAEYIFDAAALKIIYYLIGNQFFHFSPPASGKLKNM